MLKNGADRLYNRIFAIYIFMAIHKREAFAQEEQDLAIFANALSHPARIAILKLLAEQPGCICGKIVELLPLSQSTVSQHLKELKKASLVKGTIDGPRSCYCIDPEGFQRSTAQFTILLDLVKEKQADNCC